MEAVQQTASQEVDDADAMALQAEERASFLKLEAKRAREVASEALEEAATAKEAQGDAEWAEELAIRREARAKASAERDTAFRPRFRGRTRSGPRCSVVPAT